jgi:hypothetical protein
MAARPAPPRRVCAVRYAAPLREGGSLPGLVEADDDGLYVVKFRGAGQGPKALVAELVVGELGRALGLPVPEIVLVDLDPALGRAEPDPEIKELIEASGGRNVGLDFLPGSLAYTPAAAGAVDPRLAADVVWFDGLVTNIDRTPRNTNLLVWHGALWLIDHGAALYVQHAWDGPGEHARRPFAPIREHVLLPVAGPITDADARLAPLVTEWLLSSIVAEIPEDWLGRDGGRFADVAAERRAYVDYLLRRLEPPRPFVEEAERGRG